MSPEYHRGFYDAGDEIMNFINALDSAEMSARDVRSAVYGKCLEMRPVEDQLAALRREHDRRVTELLEANNREVERRRAAERLLREAAEELRASASNYADQGCRDGYLDCSTLAGDIEQHLEQSA